MSNEFSSIQQSYDTFLVKALTKSKLFSFNPVNLSREKSNFNKHKGTSPNFKYSNVDPTTVMYKDILSSLTFNERSGNKIISNLLIQKHKELNSKLSLSCATGDSSFTSKSIKVYGKPSLSLIKKAETILSEDYTIKRKRYISSDEVISQLRKSFREIGITGWKIKKENMIASASVTCETKTVALKKRERMQQGYVNRLKVHEIGTHAVRFENGKIQPLKIMKYGLANYLSTEEGLAMFSEEACNVSSQQIKRNYAGRVLAINYALEGSFSETYKNLLGHFTPDVAFKLTLRAKRGLSDTSEPGGLTKDYVYLKGYFDVIKYAKKNDITDLYIGKVGINDISDLKKLDMIEAPKYLPSHLRGSTNE